MGWDGADQQVQQGTEGFASQLGLGRGLHFEQVYVAELEQLRAHNQWKVQSQEAQLGAKVSKPINYYIRDHIPGSKGEQTNGEHTLCPQSLYT